MYAEKKSAVKDRIVSLHKDYIRPIVRGKSGKQVEFDAKVNLSHADGFLFADYLRFDNFNESQLLKHSIEAFERRFGTLPDYVCIDTILGTRENRAYLKERGIRTTVKPLGRRKSASSSDAEQRWRRRKQKERPEASGKEASGTANRTITLAPSAPGCLKPSRRGSEWDCSPAIC